MSVDENNDFFSSLLKLMLCRDFPIGLWKPDGHAFQSLSTFWESWGTNEFEISFALIPTDSRTSEREWQRLPLWTQPSRPHVQISIFSLLLTADDHFGKDVATWRQASKTNALSSRLSCGHIAIYLKYDFALENVWFKKIYGKRMQCHGATANLHFKIWRRGVAQQHIRQDLWDSWSRWPFRRHSVRNALALLRDTGTARLPERRSFDRVAPTFRNNRFNNHSSFWTIPDATQESKIVFGRNVSSHFDLFVHPALLPTIG